MSHTCAESGPLGRAQEGRVAGRAARVRPPELLRRRTEAAAVGDVREGHMRLS